MKRSSAWGAAAVAVALGGACATATGFGKAVKSGTLDIMGAAASLVFPSAYGNLVGKFFDSLKAAPPAGLEPASRPAAVATASQPAGARPSAATTPAGSPVPAGATVAAATTAPLDIEFEVVRQVQAGGAWVTVPVRNGDILRDGAGTADGGDLYKVYFSANAPCHIYVVQADATGKIDTLFPGGFSGGEKNPVRPKEEYALPAAGNWFELDRNKGIETVYFIASRDRNAELEAVLDRIQQMKLAENPPPPSAAPRINAPLVVTRGVGGERPGRDRQIAVQGGGTATFSPTVFLLPATKTSQMVLTRWFHHE